MGNPHKATNQMRRARVIIREFETRLQRPWVEIQQLALAMSDKQWDDWGTEVCGFDYPPSTETRAMAMQLIEERVEIDARWDKLNKGNQKIWEMARQ